MYKKILKATILLAVLFVFVSCQEKKDTKKPMKKSDRMMHRQKRERPTFRDNEKSCPTCPSCSEKRCETRPISKNEEEDSSLPVEEKELLSQGDSEDSLSLEDFRASIEKQNTVEAAETEQYTDE